MPTITSFSSLYEGNLIIYRSRIDDQPDSVRLVTPEVYTSLVLNEAIAIAIELDQGWLEAFGFIQNGEYLELRVSSQERKLLLRYKWPQEDSYFLEMELIDEQDEEANRNLLCHQVDDLQNLIGGITGKPAYVDDYFVALQVEKLNQEFAAKASKAH